MEQGEGQETRDLSARLSAVLAQVGELVGEVAQLERREEERDQTVRAVLTQIGLLSGQLQSVVPQATEAQGGDAVSKGQSEAAGNGVQDSGNPAPGNWEEQRSR